jgi:hypothetical protein
MAILIKVSARDISPRPHPNSFESGRTKMPNEIIPIEE